MTRRFDDQKASVRIQALVDQDPVLGYDLLFCTEMLDHRGIFPQDLASETGYTTTTINDVLSGRVDKMSLKAYRSVVDKIDHAITTISQSRGGVPEMCCGPEGLAKTVLAIHDGVRGRR
jgi:hypothetical protein